MNNKNAASRCLRCGWNNPPDTELCEKCGMPLQKVSTPYDSQRWNAHGKFDINEYYHYVRICRDCGNICKKDARECPVCGCTVYIRRIACKSMYRERECGNPNCDYRTLSPINYCPICGTKLEKGPFWMIYEDHAGLPIPTIDECTGRLKDD